MRPLGFRARALLAALLPVTLVAVVLTAVFLSGRLSDLDAAHQQRALAHARQVASAAEFGMFARNQSALQALVNNARREADVQAVSIFDVRGNLVARAGTPMVDRPTLPERADWSYEQATGDTRLVVQPIASSDLALDLQDPFVDGTTRAAQLLGYAALELSRADVIRRGEDLVLTGLFVTFVGLLVGGVLAFWLIYAVTRELSAKKDEAESATLAKSRFLAAASHDLRQPMHALGLFVERLSQLQHDAETHKLIGSVGASVRALQDLLDALLDLSRLDAGVVQPVPRPVAISEVWARLQQEFAPLAAQRGLQLRLRPSRLWVTSDALLLHRILLNLVSNAIRYTERGRILVTCRPRGERALIEVRDTGIGIPPDMQEDVFKEFVQLGNPERDRTKGLGLGLTIVQRTARLLGHGLHLESTPGRGSCFRLELPLAEPPALAFAVGGGAAPPERLDGRRVLVVDDDALAREAMADILRSWGCAVSVAGSATEALAVVPPGLEVIACDYRLPGDDNAIELIAELRRRSGRAVPAFLVTGDTDPAVLQAANASGLPLLHKPVRAARLRAMLQRLLSAGRNP